MFGLPSDSPKGPVLLQSLLAFVVPPQIRMLGDADLLGMAEPHFRDDRSE